MRDLPGGRAPDDNRYRNEVQRLLQEDAAHTPATRIVLSVPPEIRDRRPARVPHSIVEELWHIVFWQEHFLRWAHGTVLGYPEHAELGWRRFANVDDAEWHRLVEKFGSGLAEAAQIAGQPGLADTASSFTDRGPNPGPMRVSDLLINLVAHNAYHLGRIVQLRQMQGAWPPPGGGDAW